MVMTSLGEGSSIGYQEGEIGFHLPITSTQGIDYDATADAHATPGLNFDPLCHEEI
jgi:hypothetical protein